MIQMFIFFILLSDICSIFWYMFYILLSDMFQVSNALEKYENQIEYIHVSDQYSGNKNQYE